MSDRLLTSHALSGPSSEALREHGRAWWLAFTHSYRAAVTRRELAELDARLLADIGVSPVDASTEAARTPWDLGPRRQPARPSRRPARIGSLWQNLRIAMRRHRSRQQIASLDAAGLKDIGVTFAEAEAEANKPFWRA